MCSVSVDRAAGSQRVRRGFHRGWAWLIGLGLASSTAASSHPQFGPATINRYGRLVLTAPDRARLFYTVMVGDIPALRLRQRADADHNGQLDAAEQAALQAEIAAQVQQGLSLHLGPHGLPLTWESAQLSISEAAVSARALAFDAVAVSGPMGPQAAASPWRYQDRVQLAPVGEVELRIEEAPGVWLRGSRGPTTASPGSPIASPPKAEPFRRLGVSGIYRLYPLADRRAATSGGRATDDDHVRFWGSGTFHVPDQPCVGWESDRGPGSFFSIPWPEDGDPFADESTDQYPSCANRQWRISSHDTRITGRCWQYHESGYEDVVEWDLVAKDE